MASRKALTNELGHGGLAVTPWNSLYDETEEVNALAWPNNIQLFDRMSNDEQIAHLMLALLLPIQNYEWFIDANGAEDNVTEHVANNLGLPISGQDPAPRGRRKGRFNFEEHLRVALPLPLRYGALFCEQVYRVEDDLLHLRKLAPRMPRTISQVKVAVDGGLEGVVQHPPGRNGLQGGLTYGVGGIEIPVDRLVAYVHDKEGGNWYGRSILRALYRAWRNKDLLIRIDTIKHERNGSGIPLGELPPNATEAQRRSMQTVVDAMRSSDVGGATYPNGGKITLEGVRGTLPNTIESIRYHDEQMAKRFLAMFSSLGSTATGSRALGETFVDAFSLAQQSIAQEFADTFNTYVIEDLVDLNWGEGTQAPELRFRASKKELAVADLKMLVESGLLVVDESIRQEIRSNFDLPDEDPETPDELAPVIPITKSQQTDDQTDPSADEGKPVAASHQHEVHAAAEVMGRKLRRNYTEIEMASGADFDAMEATYNGSVAFLVSQWQALVSAKQIESLVSQIAEAGSDLAKLTLIEAPVLGAELLASELQRVASVSITQAVAEAAAQGATITPPSIDELLPDIQARAEAMATVMAGSITDTAKRKALSQAGAAVTGQELAAVVAEHLNGLSTSYLKEQLGGAVNTAQNDARFECWDDSDVKSYYASEILDSVTCPNCKKVDNREYATKEEARKDYVAGGYKLCQGGSKCRGTVVAIMQAEAAPTVIDVESVAASE